MICLLAVLTLHHNGSALHPADLRTGFHDWRLFAAFGTICYSLIGLDLARTRSPDLVLLDLNLPDMSGSEALRRLRADPVTKDIPVVIVSADATAGQIARLKAEGAADYIAKPFDIAQLTHLVDRLRPT